MIGLDVKKSTDVLIFIVIFIAVLHSFLYLLTGGPTGKYKSLINTNRFPLTFTLSPLPLVFDSDMFFTKTTIEVRDENLNIVKKFNLDADFFSEENFSNHLQLHLMRYPYFVESFPEHNMFDQIFCHIIDRQLPELQQKNKSINFIEISLSNINATKKLSHKINCN